MMTLLDKFYQKPDRKLWHGRIDDPTDRDSFRWHQIMQLLDLQRPINKLKNRSFAILGFKCDEGVARNLGRVGASAAPDQIRSQLANLPSYFNDDVNIFDAGNLFCNKSLEEAQQALAEAVYVLLSADIFPILIGGGHEIAFGHYLGLRKYFIEQKKELPAIINVDAHFDMRPFFNGGSSGTMFYQIAELNRLNNEKFKYLAVGIQQSANTKSLFQRCEKYGGEYILARNIDNRKLAETNRIIDNFHSDSPVYLTLCMDVFSSAVAPGVSAPQPFGVYPENVLKIIKHIALSGRLVSFDLAEVSPRFDDDNQTAKLASIIIFAVVNTLYDPQSNLVIET